MQAVSERKLIKHGVNDPLCDGCDALVEVSRSEARIIRLRQPLFCERCSTIENYKQVLDDLRSDVRAAVEDDDDGPEIIETV